MPASQRRRASGILVALAIVALVVVFMPMDVRAASSSVKLDHWGSVDQAWRNGNLNRNNSGFPEGGVVPFRLAIEGLQTGSHTVHINYDFTAGGHKAYDFLASWNAWRSPNLCGAGGGVSSMCPGLPAPSSRAFPGDGFTANGLTVNDAEVFSGVSRRLTIWGGTITGISGPVHSGSVSDDSSGDFTVTFTSSGSAVLLAWGGHLAQSAYWDTASGGQRNGAGTVSASNWRMRTLELDGAGNRDRHLKIQPDAIAGELPAPVVAPTPPPAPQPTPPSAPAPTATQPASTNPPAATTPPAATSRPGAPAPTPRLTPPPTSILPNEGTAPGSEPVVPAALFLAALAVLFALAARNPLPDRSRRR